VVTAPRGTSAVGGGAEHMNTLQFAIRRLRRFEDGQDLIEYALLTALISVVAIAGVKAVGSSVLDSFWTVIAQGLSAQ